VFWRGSWGPPNNLLVDTSCRRPPRSGSARR